MQTQEMLTQFDSQGFVVIEDLLDHKRDLQPLVEDYFAPAYRAFLSGITKRDT